jgi:hypothetical protein
VRYVDDAVFGFQYEAEGRAFLEALRERLEAYGLKLHPTKTRLVEFGRFATSNRRERGQGKPETFDYLGFHAYLWERRAMASSGSHARPSGSDFAGSWKKSNKS